MKSFLEEYGFAILAAIVVILLIAMCSPVGNMVKTQVLNTVERFAGTADKKLASANNDEMSANIIGGTLYVQSNSTTDQYTVVLHGTKAGSKHTIALGDPDAGVGEAVKSWNLDVSEFDTGSTYYAKVTNVGTGAVFTSNIVTNDGGVGGGESGPTYENVDGDKDGKHYHNDALFTGTCGGKDYVDGVEQAPVTYLSTTDKYVGYYADVDGNNTIDGVIFFDYAHGATTDTGYLGSGVAVTAKTSGLANYKMAEINGKEVVQKATSGDDRFYVIASSDILPTTPVSSKYAYWYNSAYYSGISNYNTVASTAFGAGKTNTSTMLAKWNAAAYGAKDNGDMWSNIPNGWFVLSKDEWSVLGSELNKVSTGSYSSMTTNAGVVLSFSDCYWSSSLSNSNRAWYTNFDSSNMDVRYGSVNYASYVRVASTF